jgi:large subunit ribosomal protein L15
MQQHELRQPQGATHKRKRVGRGNASGHGTYATKGLKGQKARSGGGVRPGFEGGQLPLVRRMASKRGFRNPFRIDYEEVNVGQLARFAAGSEVNGETLGAARLVRTGKPVKILGEGDLGVALTVEAASFSKSAESKIEAAGGSVRWLNGKPVAEEPAAAAEAKPKSRKAAPKAEQAEEPAAAAEAKPKSRKTAPKAEQADATAPEGEEEA